MNRYELIKGFDKYEDAKDYADRLPKEAIAKVVPYDVPVYVNGVKVGNSFLFAIDVSRDYVGGRL